MNTDAQFISLIKEFQRNEITEHIIYQKIAKTIPSEYKRKIVEQIAADEKSHYEFWKKITNEDVKPNQIKIIYYQLLIKLLGINHGIRLMEKGEQKSQFNYAAMLLNIPNSQWIIDDENSHENKLIEILHKIR